MHTIRAERITTVFFLFFLFLTWDWRDRKNKRATWGVLEDGWCYAILYPLFVTVPGTSALPSVSVHPRECRLSAEGEKRRWEKPTRVQNNWMGKGLATVDERIFLWKKKNGGGSTPWIYVISIISTSTNQSKHPQEWIPATHSQSDLVNYTAGAKQIFPKCHYLFSSFPQNCPELHIH